jgi:hypothetical protein
MTFKSVFDLGGHHEESRSLEQRFEQALRARAEAESFDGLSQEQARDYLGQRQDFEQVHRSFAPAFSSLR